MWDVLQRLHREGQLALLERDTGRPLRGFVGAFSNDLALINIVTPECRFDGGVVIRTDDIEFVRWGTTALRARSGAVLESPTAPEALTMADLSSWLTVIDRLAVDEPVLTLHRENDSEWHVATSITATTERVEAEELAEDGTVDGTIVFKLSDLTRIDFGGGYERSHARLSRAARLAADNG